MRRADHRHTTRERIIAAEVKKLELRQARARAVCDDTGTTGTRIARPQIAG